MRLAQTEQFPLGGLEEEVVATHDRVEDTRFHRFDQYRLFAVLLGGVREADEPDFALLAQPVKRRGQIGIKNGAQVGDLGNPMQLEQVNDVRLQPSQTLLHGALQRCRQEIKLRPGGIGEIFG